MADFEKFIAIRRCYENVLPRWQECYERTGRMAHDPYLMDWEFSPIEANAWGDIRALGLPFYPQVPVLKYFLDFANPFLKIGIECDGKEWHGHGNDAARDRMLAAAGWTIFRLEGHECCREIDLLPDCEGHDVCSCGWYERDQFYSTTSEGLLTAVREIYFGSGEHAHAAMMRSTLAQHRSTPDNAPKRRTIASGDGPVRLSTISFIGGSA